MTFYKQFHVKPGRRVRLADYDPDCTGGLADKSKAEKPLAKHLERLSQLQYLLYAEGRRALLVVLQAMDAGGKDGTIRHVMSGLNPQGCRVTSFKVPSARSWRTISSGASTRPCPAKGEIGIFNRSHYEDVLVVRVHKLVAEKTSGPRGTARSTGSRKSSRRTTSAS